MKFAFLGMDEEAIVLARYLASHREHQLVAVHEPGAWKEEIASLDAGVFTPSTWEALLHEPVADAVIVANGHQAERSEQVLQLAKAGSPLLVVSPVSDVVTAYELEMIRRDTQAPLAPYVPGRLHPAIAWMAEAATGGESSALGAIEQVVLERSPRDRGREAVLRQFTRDMSLLRAILGDLTKISAMGPSPNAPAWSNLNVQMSGASAALARWSLQPASDDLDGTLTLYGVRGRAVLRMSRQAPWELTITGSQPSSRTFDDWHEPSAVIGHFERAFRGETVSPAWQDACRDLETAETVERSLTRGRTLEMHDDEVSEEATFKGIMAVGGCGMLMLGLFGVVAASVVDGLQLPFRHHLLWRLWPAYLLTPLVVFLLLQSLQVVFRQTASPPRSKSGSHDDSASAND